MGWNSCGRLALHPHLHFIGCWGVLFHPPCLFVLLCGRLLVFRSIFSMLPTNHWRIEWEENQGNFGGSRRIPCYGERVRHSHSSTFGEKVINLPIGGPFLPWMLSFFFNAHTKNPEYLWICPSSSAFIYSSSCLRKYHFWRSAYSKWTW